jgi:AcrR family transcriptional regulator
MSDKSRPYRKTRRAELEQETRLRITEATVELHGTVGPARTSVSAVAERAGVRRSTVYRHFADEAALFAACSTHWLAAHPFPELAAWAAIEDHDKRLHEALSELYGYYRVAEPMLANLHRDEDLVPLVKQLFAAFHGYLGAARDTLMRGRGGRAPARRRAAAAIGHALAFTTWSSLSREQGLSDGDAADLMCRLVGVAAHTSAEASQRPR